MPLRYPVDETVTTSRKLHVHIR